MLNFKMPDFVPVQKIGCLSYVGCLCDVTGHYVALLTRKHKGMILKVTASAPVANHETLAGFLDAHLKPMAIKMRSLVDQPNEWAAVY